MKISIGHSAKIESANGVFVTEFDCNVEVTVGYRHYGDVEHELISIDAIIVTNGLRGVSDVKVTDLLDKESGLLTFGELIREKLLTDTDFQERCIEEHRDRDDYEGSKADYLYESRQAAE